MQAFKNTFRAATAALALIMAAPVPAQEYPSRPVRLICPYAAGGLTDILARTVAQELSRRLGQPVIVENRAGGGGIAGTDFAAKAAPDGYTLTLAGQGLASVNTSLYPHLPYDTLRDFKPLSHIAKFSLVLVGHPRRAPESVSDLIHLARKNPDALSYGSAGNASTAHLAMEMFKEHNGLSLLHVPFKGESAALMELVAGRIDSMFATVGGSLALIRGGKLRAIAIPDDARNPLLADVPTMREAGIEDFNVFGWFVVLAPANVPERVADRLGKEFMAIGSDPGFRKAMLERGMQAVGSSAAEAAQMIEKETGRWAALVKKTGIALD